MYDTVLGSINDTCIMIRILIQKKVSSIKYHDTFLVQYQYSITDTFQVYQYRKSLIHDCDTFTGIQNSLSTRFAISVMNSSSRVSTTLSRFQILTMLPRDNSWSWRRFLWLQHNTINWLSSQCCRKGMYLSDTDTELKCWQDTGESGKFSSNSTQLYHRLHHSSKKTVQHG